MTTTFHSIDQLLGVVVEHDASDLHLAVGSPPVMRVHGRLERIPEASKLTWRPPATSAGVATRAADGVRFVTTATPSGLLKSERSWRRMLCAPDDSFTDTSPPSTLRLTAPSA